MSLYEQSPQKEDSDSNTLETKPTHSNDFAGHASLGEMSEVQVQLALRASGVGMWDWNLTTGELVWTDQKKALFAFSPETPISYQLFLDTVHPDDRERVHKANLRAIEEKQEYDKDYRIIWPDGSIHWLTDRAQGILDASGRVTRIVGVTFDITNLKQHEVQLQEANERITTILDSITDAFLGIDNQWRYTYVNRRMEAYMGRSLAEVMGKPVWEVVPEILGTDFEHHYRKAMETRQAQHCEGFHPTFQRWVEAYIYPNPNGLSIYFHDIDERKQAEIALRENEERLRRFVDSNIIGIMITDQDGNICEANDAFLSLIGYTREDLAAGNIPWPSITSPEFQARDALAIEEAVRTGVAQPYEKEYIAKDSRHVPALIGRALFRQESSTSFLICFVLDLTARKEIERQKDLFLGMTGHELKTPLAALQGTIQLNLRRLERITKNSPSPPPELDNFLTKLVRSLTDSLRYIEMQTRLINDMLDVSRIASNTLTLSLKVCDLVAIVRDTISDVRLAHPKRSLLLDLPEHTPVMVFVDSNRISQVVMNYVSNALRYSPADKPVMIGLDIEGVWVRVWVRDQGPGLSKDAMKRIWQSYYQASNVSVQCGTDKGLGLGLYICRTLIEQHQGTVGVESILGQGSTFWFCLPIKK
ncbi:PAS domain-containing sensor histidine kinase [Ktedonospora formicarum]|uniref:histidine kinase n=1 Tax=Ktedonospora formicarum TaxID=2778364 RepID=A0A8J3IAX0_9CHLR|nr:PAS domain-containing sensor histidine kinase [Ktedonospora formicarum]GHO47964.1 hypothetical protein KSX_61270 [Ktedonospora formicarum]